MLLSSVSEVSGVPHSLSRCCVVVLRVTFLVKIVSVDGMLVVLVRHGCSLCGWYNSTVKPAFLFTINPKIKQQWYSKRESIYMEM